MNELISVIIPVYNVEKHLDRCIESVVNQTYKDLEIILVDDGSPDNCPAMCDEWAEKDSRIKVIHKQNGGVSSARNAGILSAHGKFVHFTDADDWLDLKCFETLVMEFDNDSELLVFGAYSFDGKIQEPVFINSSAIINGQENIKNAFIGNKLNRLNCWSKFYLLNIIKRNNICFNESYIIGEDYRFTYDYLSFIERVKIIDKPLYVYDVSRDNSAMNSKNDFYFRRWIVSEEIYKTEKNEEVKTQILKRLGKELTLCSYETAVLDDKKTLFYEVAKKYRKYYRAYCKLNEDTSKPMLLLYISPFWFRKYRKALTLKYNKEVENGK